jgi:hypothetical protein
MACLMLLFLFGQLISEFNFNPNSIIIVHYQHITTLISTLAIILNSHRDYMIK